ncbi:MAG: hypothetical protein HY609_03225 [Deltaproteobacteria bacterium]|nr:hypothetical protein [Deltaproteobacteria bacterium]MBI4223921.1 hypothetical protein [Deltaproteobacteria bacterium]
MNPIFLLLTPVALGLITLFIRGDRKRSLRRQILFWGALFHLSGTLSLFLPNSKHAINPFLTLDALGLLFLTLTSVLFFLVSIYSFGYFFKEYRSEQERGMRHLYAPCMLFFLASTTLAALTSHLGLLWVAIEATTLATAPLIYYHHHARALEAAWKYLLICSVGIALALLGIFFIAAAGKGKGLDLFVFDFVANAKSLDVRWLKIGFLLVLVGFGTKMGLAPLHNWLPDAHSESPSSVSALLSGALLNIAFLGILRCYQICAAAGLAHFADTFLILLGVLSLVTAFIFITNQKDYKRMLAYSSVEHMGILSLGLGVGASFATLLHMINHSLAKVLLFLTAGQIVLGYRTKKVAEVHGLLKTLPATGILFVMGGLAVLGLPPFAPFISEFLILRDALVKGHTLAAVLYLVCLGMIFVAMSKILLGMAQGEKHEIPGALERYPWLMFSPMVLAAALLIFGLYLPPPLVRFLNEAARLLGGGS